MSHEIRTPLNGILGMAESLLHDQELTTRQKSVIDTILESGRMLLSVLNDILDFSKIEAGKLHLEQTSVDLRFIFQHFEMVSKPSAEQKGIQLITRIDPALPQYLVGDTKRIQQIVSNLISNAIKFTNKGTITLEVGGELLPDRMFDVRFSVKDTGIGIPESALPNLFQPFNQADASYTRQYGGTGLGLSICKSLVDLMHGQMTVASLEGEGTTFTVCVRLAIGEIPLPKLKRVYSELDTSMFERTRLLLAEDNIINQKVAERSLKQIGIGSIDFATDGKRAVEMYAHNSYDIILMDVMMPVMDGIKATKLIREIEKSEQRPRIPIIAVTAGALQADREACFDAGMDDHIPKPFSQDDLRDHIHSQLMRK
jgi:CheY-like chemotaxis protein/anti-sigma regulatory factor (Ser/Thr protein kinase)